MDIKIAVNTEALDSLMVECRNEVMRAMADVGREFVDDAVAEGNYRNRTGNLRRSNFAEVDENGLTLGNKADYASDVESRGFEVCSTFALRAVERLQEKFGK